MKKDMLKSITEFLPDINEFTISLIGLNKNSGKTVTLIYLINQLQKEELNVAVTSIGYDGEKLDLIFHHDKPEFIVPKGTIVATAEVAVNKIQGEYLILDDIDEYGPLGKTYILKANEPISVELVGPSSIDGLLILKKKLKKYSKRIFIDGAYNRIAQISPKLADYSILAIGGTSIEITKERLEKLSLIIKIPKYEGESLNQKCKLNSHYVVDSEISEITDDELKSIKGKKIIHSGAFTNQIARLVIKNKNVVIIEDITKIFVNKNILQKLINNKQIYIEKKENLIFVSYNPKNFNGSDYNSKELGRQISKYLPDINCCDIVSSFCYKGGRVDAILK
ncbi:MAG: hypothetical protein ACLFPS_05490 [Clostridia bacterium]